jgi:hypothetical protein
MSLLTDWYLAAGTLLLAMALMGATIARSVQRRNLYLAFGYALGRGARAARPRRPATAVGGVDRRNRRLLSLSVSGCGSAFRSAIGLGACRPSAGPGMVL